MKHIQSIFNGIPKTKGYNKCTLAERKRADEIYNKLVISTGDIHTFFLPHPLTGINVIRALMVQHLPYVEVLYKWYTVDKVSDGRYLNIELKEFKKIFKKNKEVKDAIKNIVSELNITDNTDDYTKAKLLAEYLAQNVKYCYEEDNSLHQAWDCLIRKKTLCCGYSEGYKALCDYCNIRCQCVTSHDHQWNRVCINGKWLNVDTCWLATGGAKSYYLLTDNKVFYSNHMKYAKKMACYWKFN